MISNYRLFATMQKSPVQGRLMCIENFKKTNDEFIAFLSSSAILDYENTLAEMVSQNLSMVSPKLITNQNQPKMKMDCSSGWNQTISGMERFPNIEVEGHYKENFRFKVICSHKIR